MEGKSVGRSVRRACDSNREPRAPPPIERVAPNPTRVDVATAARYRAPVTASAWVFDPLPPSGAISGGTAANYVFAPTIDIFVREVLQNAHDQRLPTPGFAQVDIDVMEFTGEHRRRIFEAMSFDGLRAHLDGIAGEPYKLGAQVRDALARLDGGAPLRVLRVTDRHTEGLTGGEDEKGTNFYGLGKAVLWRFSAISTVLFASKIDVGGATQLRAFGRGRPGAPRNRVRSMGRPGLVRNRRELWIGSAGRVAVGRRCRRAGRGDRRARGGLRRDRLVRRGRRLPGARGGRGPVSRRDRAGDRRGGRAVVLAGSDGIAADTAGCGGR